MKEESVDNSSILDCEYYYPPKRLFFESQSSEDISLWLRGKTKNGKRVGIWEEYHKDGSFKSKINFDRISN